MREEFKTAAEAVGAVVTFHRTVGAAVEHLAQLAAGATLSSSMLPGSVARALALRTDIVSGKPPSADLCVSHALAGIAATGSLLLDLGDTAGRGATALALRHAVLLNAGDIVPDLAAASPLLAGALASGGPAYLSLTSGPSRTADIERVLTIGVHGAKELHILVVEEDV